MLCTRRGGKSRRMPERSSRSHMRSAAPEASSATNFSSWRSSLRWSLRSPKDALLVRGLDVDVLRGNGDAVHLERAAGLRERRTAAGVLERDSARHEARRAVLGLLDERRQTVVARVAHGEPGDLDLGRVLARDADRDVLRAAALD